MREERKYLIFLFFFSPGPTSIQVGSSSSQAASAQAAILAGLGTVASILLL